MKVNFCRDSAHLLWGEGMNEVIYAVFFSIASAGGAVFVGAVFGEIFPLAFFFVLVYC